MKIYSLKWAVVLVSLQTMLGATAYADASANTTFSDISKVTSDKKAAIQEAVSRGLLSGDPQGTFRPAASLTRQELAVLLVRALKLEPSSDHSMFKDVKDNQFAAPYIEAAQKAGLLSGDGAGNFRPNEPVTREELAAVFVRAVGGTDAKSGSIINPKDQFLVSNWAAESVKAALRLGLIDHKDSKVNPQGLVKREDIAAYLLDIFNTQEQTAVIDSVDRDIVTINQVPYLIDGQLKAFIGNSNKEALVGAKLKFNSRNRRVDGLKELEIIRKDVVLDTNGLTEASVLKISGDNVQIKGDIKGQLDLEEGASNIQLSGNVNHLTVNSSKGISIKGNGSIKELKVSNSNAKLILNPALKIDVVQLPKDTLVAQVIQNYNEVRQQIGQVQDVNGNGVTEKPPAASIPNTTEIGSTPEAPKVNHEPSVISKIDDVLFSAGDQLKTINLSNVFTDPDGDTLSFTAVSSDSDIVRVTTTKKLNGDELNLFSVNSGTAVVTVTANDGHGHAMAVTFSVTVQFAPPSSSNHDPVVKNDLAAVTVDVTDGVKKISLADVFQDEDGDALTYTAESSVTGVATVAVNGSELTLTPVNAGTATIKVTADDGKGGKVSSSFTLTLTPAPLVNHQPVVSNTISDVGTETGAQDKTIGLSSIFSDEDQDVLTYSAVSLDAGVATVSVTNDQLSITPLVAGSTTVTVTASDGHGGSVQTNFKVTVQEKKGIFFSELVWGQSEANLQIIEIYNPTSETIDASKIRIERSDGGEPIVISPQSGAYVPGGATFTIGETMYFGDVDVHVDYYTDMGFYNDDSNPVTLSLYYDGQLVDTAVYTPHTSKTRISNLTHGNAGQYEATEWTDEGTDYTDGLNSYNGVE
ncbi:S-layer homology domain-containing protein [Paenibacillus tuaregi]|uniref:S-layer homology domain-containing protein n=1 Tax=Paenibacillus tuaregi TaxID=1816681 RepID=UPI0008395B6E|nr:S-layer homology domain-containing protein [Paenibacillus tuaregi]